MIDFSKYVGIPNKKFGTDNNVLDCIGLCQKVYAAQHWYPTEWTDGKPMEDNWFETDPYHMHRFLVKNFTKVDGRDELSEGDLVLFSINGEAHISIYIGYGRILSTFPPVSQFSHGCSFVDKIRCYEKCLRAYFKRKK